MRAIRHAAIYTRILAVLFIAVLMLQRSVDAKINPLPANTHTVEFSRLIKGQYVIDAYLNGQGPFKFMIDTAASRTSIFEKTRQKLGIAKQVGSHAYISGITNAGYRPTIIAKNLTFAGQIYENHKIVVLEDWVDNDEQFDGILGLEVFENLMFQFTHAQNQLTVSKPYHLGKTEYKKWKRIKLRSTPYSGEDYGLLFMRTKIGNLSIPTMMDTGANFTTLNWIAVQGSVVEKQKRRLHKKWVIQGAVGAFNPRKYIRVKTIKIGGIPFKNHEVLIMNFDQLPINGNGKYPLMITGVDFLEDRDFAFDFKHKRLHLGPKYK